MTTNKHVKGNDHTYFGEKHAEEKNMCGEADPLPKKRGTIFFRLRPKKGCSTQKAGGDKPYHAYEYGKW